MDVEFKRGYAKWKDENRKFHKVPEAEYKAMIEIIELKDEVE